MLLDTEKWARSVESEIDKGQFVSVSEAQRTSLSDLIARYQVEVTPTMKGATEDTIRLNAIRGKLLSLMMLKLFRPPARSSALADSEIFKLLQMSEQTGRRSYQTQPAVQLALALVYK